MSIYTPDTWSLIAITLPDDEPTYKILAGWYGGFTTGDSWKLSSGVVKVEDDGVFYEVVDHSGSVYFCNKKSNKLSMYLQQIYDYLIKSAKKSEVEINIVNMDEWMKNNGQPTW